MESRQAHITNLPKLTKYASFSSLHYKRNLVNNLLHRSYSICNSYTTIDSEFQSIKDTLLKNGYQLSFIDKSIRQFFKQKVQPKQNLKLIYSLDFLIWAPFPTTSKKNFTSTQKPTCQILSRLFLISTNLNNNFWLKTVNDNQQEAIQCTDTTAHVDLFTSDKPGEIL